MTTEGLGIYFNDLYTTWHIPSAALIQHNNTKHYKDYFCS